MFAFDAAYDEAGAFRAQRAFQLRSYQEIRRAELFGAPVLFAANLLICVWLDSPLWINLSMAFFLALSVLGPLASHYRLPKLAARYAREHPVRQVSLTAEAVQIRTADRTRVIPWEQIAHVWEAEGHLLLVVNRLISINIPLGSLPPGARAFIEASAQSRLAPISVTYSFALDHERVDQFRQAVTELMKELCLPVESATADVTGWRGESSYVTLYTGTGAPCRLIVGAQVQTSHQWHKVASRLEPLLAEHATRVEAHIQPNPNAAGAAGSKAAPIQVTMPVNFQK